MAAVKTLPEGKDVAPRLKRASGCRTCSMRSVANCRECLLAAKNNQEQIT
jgi:hypothetical protein